MLEYFDFDDVVSVQESASCRPHYRVTLKRSLRGHPDLAPGLLRDELEMTVCLPLTVGTDLRQIKHAAAHRFSDITGRNMRDQHSQPSDERSSNALPDRNGPAKLDQRDTVETNAD